MLDIPKLHDKAIEKMVNNTLESIFEERFWKYGEIFNEEYLPESIRFLYEIPLHYLTTGLESAKTSTGNAYPFSVRYILNGSFNAAACDAGNVGLVCIHSSLPILLFMACVNYATRCDIGRALPKQRDDSIIVYDKKIKLLGYLSDSKLMNIIEVFDEFLSSISDNKIIQYGQFLYDNAIRFVAMHECMHIVLGHAAYIENKLGLNIFVEFSAERDQQIQPSFNQAIELLADRNSSCGILTQALMGNILHPYGRVAPDFLEVNFRKFVIRSVVQALCILLHLFPYKVDRGLKSTMIRTHPHPYVRMQWIIREIGHHLIENEEKFTEELVYPFGCALVTLSANFITPNSWMVANEEDMNDENRMFSDDAYSSVSRLAKELQSEMWNFAPQYDGFTRGWEHK